MAEIAGQRKSWSPELSALGLACRRCGCRHFYVVYTRRASGGRLVRRRECRNCGQRLTTVEQEK
jgi:hypothetical protein